MGATLGFSASGPSPVLMMLLLLRVSGVTLLEESLKASSIWESRPPLIPSS
jgi:steroid 5-alpha reductase family enzyme